MSDASMNACFASLNESEIEFLWMAVLPEAVRHGIGTWLVKYILDSVGNEKHVFLLTATEDSTIPGTEFNGASFSGTANFFAKLGFKLKSSQD